MWTAALLHKPFFIRPFLYPAALTARVSRVERRRVAYIIRDGRLWAPGQDVERKTLSIAGRAVATLTASNGVGGIFYRIYATVRRDGVEFNLAYIDDDFAVPYKGPFDPVVRSWPFAP